MSIYTFKNSHYALDFNVQVQFHNTSQQIANARFSQKNTNKQLVTGLSIGINLYKAARLEPPTQFLNF